VVTRAERATSFGAIAGDYDRLRPSPPAAAVDWLLPPHCRVAADLAAGTGLLSRQLAGRAGRVVAVEPDGRMAAVLHARSPGAAVVLGTAEEIPLANASADGVFVSSAWHWLDPGRASAEIARVLRRGGRFGIIWTGRDADVDWLREAARQLTAAAAGPGANGVAPPLSGHREVTLPGAARFGEAETAEFRFTRAMSIGDIVDMLATYSRVITASPPDRAAALARARTVVRERFPGASEVDVPMQAWCWRADRAS
jgi:SAM-dependent methyltransferase